MPFEILEKITRADVALSITGKDLEELFTSGAEAVNSVMTANPEIISKDTDKYIKLREKDIEWLFFNFLQEIIFFKDAESLLLLPEKIQITSSKHGYYCKGLLKGEKIDPAKHDLKVDIKAVTMHKYSLKKEKGLWTAIVVLDV